MTAGKPLTHAEHIDALDRLYELPDLVGDIPGPVLDMLERLLVTAAGRDVHDWLISSATTGDRTEPETLERLGSVIRHPAFKPGSISGEQP